MQKEDKYASVKGRNHNDLPRKQGVQYRRITAELHKRNFLLNHKTVQRLMKELGLVCRVRMKKYRSYKGEVGKIAPHLLNRDFHAEKPNQKWVTDVTEFSLFGAKLYLSPILDLCSSDLVSYTISDRPALTMVTTMLDEAFAKIPAETNLILHSSTNTNCTNRCSGRKVFASTNQTAGLPSELLYSTDAPGERCSEHEPHGNCHNAGKLKRERIFAEFTTANTSNWDRISRLQQPQDQGKAKGLPPAIHRQQSPFRLLEQFLLQNIV